MSIGFKDYLFKYLKQNEAVIDVPRQSYATGVFSNPEDKDPKIKPEIISTGNIGCITQIAKGTNIPILHTIELIDWYTGGPKPDVLKRL